MSFREFRTLTEANATVLQHLTHLEDLPIFEGKTGSKRAITFVQGLFSLLKGRSSKSLNVSVKFDGSPSIICGKDPADGKFFVATKSLFNKGEPKYIKGPGDVQKWYADSPGLGETLLTAWTLLRNVPWPQILQGDLLFTNKIKNVTDIDGVSHVVFQPNTIAYAVPTDSPLGQSILRAKVGIAFHTSYTGTSITDLKMSAGADLSRMKTGADVFLTSGDYRDLSGTLTLTDAESTFIGDQIAKLASDTDALTAGNRFIDLVNKDENAQGLFTRYQNDVVRQNKNLNPKATALGFYDFLNALSASEQQKRKTPAGKASVKSDYDRWVGTFSYLEKDMIRFIDWQQRIVTVKSLLLNKLNTAQRFAAYVNTGDGLSPSAQEGFVAADRSGRLVKFVDRANFSRINMLASKNRK